MKQFIFIAIALIFITSLLPANLSCQVIIVDDPVCNLGVPHPVEHDLTIKLNDNQKFNDWKENKQNNSNGFLVEQRSRDKEFINRLKELHMLIFGVH